MDTNDFGKKLRKVRIHSGMTQQDLADRLCVSKAVVSSYEQDVSTPSFLKLIDIAGIFNVSTDYLLSVGDDYMDERFKEPMEGDSDNKEKARRLSERFMGIGDQIRELREERGLSRQQLASALSLSTMAIGKYERDVMAPSYGTLIDMARFFDVSTEKLFGVDTGRKIDISGLSDEKKVLVKELVRGMR